MYRSLFVLFLLSVASSAYAQTSPEHGSDYKVHGSDYNGEHDHKTDATKDIESQSHLRLADQPELHTARQAGGEPIVAKVLGVVCEFCTKAMNKTFGKRDDVAAVYVDLDTKTLNLVMKPGHTLSDEDLRKLVKKSGYKVDIIARGSAIQ